MKITRRDLLIWGAGATAALAATPVPWKVLDDVSIWSQNWPWIPQPARGPVEVKQTSCTLCPNGCGLRIRMAAGWPVGISGANTHPITHGTLCPLAFGAHQLNWHPQRIKVVRQRGTASSWSEARAAFSNACSEGPIVVIDGRPGRAASEVLKDFAEKHGGSYRVAVGPETRALAPYAEWTGVPASSFGYDLENAQTIVSFGAPLLDGWGIPGRFSRMWAEHAAGMNDPQLRLIQIESSFSRTAARAWKWVPIREGTGPALAAGLARALLEQNLVSKHGPMPPLTVAEAADQSGLTAETIRDLARTIVARIPALAISQDEDPATAALNVLLGAVGARGGVVQRSQSKFSYASADGDIGNARAVLIDSTVPWNFAPQTDAEIFRFAAWDGGGSNANWLLSAPGFVEDLTDIPSAPTSAVETYAVAPSLGQSTPNARSAAHFLKDVVPELRSVEEAIHARCADLFRARKGMLYGQQAMPLAQIPSTQKLEEQLWNGAVWVGEPPRSPSLPCELKEWPASVPPKPAPNWASAWAAPLLPPLASKLYIESNLRETPARRNA